MKMLIYDNYIIIESEKEFRENFRFEGYHWEHREKPWICFDYAVSGPTENYLRKYEPLTKEFPCAYKCLRPRENWVLCPIEEAIGHWNKVIPDEIQWLYDFLNKANNLDR